MDALRFLRNSLYAAGEPRQNAILRAEEVKGMQIKMLPLAYTHTYGAKGLRSHKKNKTALSCLLFLDDGSSHKSMGFSLLFQTGKCVCAIFKGPICMKVHEIFFERKGLSQFVSWLAREIDFQSDFVLCVVVCVSASSSLSHTMPILCQPDREDI